MYKHIVQSQEWGMFKSQYGTPAIQVGDIQYTKHKIPYTGYYMAYCPRVNPKCIDFQLLSSSLKDQNCIAINFDVPNVQINTIEAEECQHIFQTHMCKLSPRDQFARFNIVLDIGRPEDSILATMHPKHRYNIRLAEKKGVFVKHAQTLQDYDVFYKLLSDTAQRQKYYIHSYAYYKKIWELMYPMGMCHIVTAYYGDEPLSSWMLFTYENVLYYPYGGSSDKHQNLFASNLVAWEAIKLGKAKACTTFDMWGASADLNDQTDPWWGFSNFKIKFGGNHIEYMHSYDFVLNNAIYYLFTAANNLRWKILNLLRR